MERASRSWKAQRQRGKWLRALLLALVVFIFIIPLVWSLLASLNVIPDDSQSPPTWSWPPSLENYDEIGVVTPIFAQAFLQSVAIAVAATLLTTAIAFLAAYSLARTHARGVWVMVQSFLILASVPVMAFAIPLTIIVRAARLFDSFGGIVLAASAVLAPLAVYVLYGYARQHSPDLEEAARLDGANIWQILWRVVLPLNAAGVAATAIIVFVLNWNMLLVPLVLSQGSIKTIPLIVSGFFFLEREMSWQSAAAVLIVSLVPLLAVIAAAHQLLERFSLLPTQTAGK